MHIASLEACTTLNTWKLASRGHKKDAVTARPIIVIIVELKINFNGEFYSDYVIYNVKRIL